MNREGSWSPLPCRVIGGLRRELESHSHEYTEANSQVHAWGRIPDSTLMVGALGWEDTFRRAGP